MRAAGCAVEVVACDAADEGATRALLKRIAAEGPPLRGVAHGALVLDDALFAEATPERVAAAARPKLAGATVLDRLTRSLPIEHFLLFSSIAALFGNPGQTAYVAANAGIEAIARARRAEGLPALAVQWGPIADAGVLADDDAARARLERRGAGLMTASDALDRLETALAGRRPDDAVLAIAPMRWAALAPDLPLLASPLFERVDLSRGPAAAGGAADLRAAVAGRDDASALKVLIDLFRAEAATILRQAPEDVDPNRPMADLGFDSLMGVELKLSTEEKYGVALPVFSLSDGATLAALAARVLADLRRTETDGAPQAQPEAEDDAMEAMVARHVGAGAGAAARARLEGEGGA